MGNCTKTKFNGVISSPGERVYNTLRINVGVGNGLEIGLGQTTEDITITAVGLSDTLYSNSAKTTAVSFPLTLTAGGGNLTLYGDVTSAFVLNVTSVYGLNKLRLISGNVSVQDSDVEGLYYGSMKYLQTEGTIPLNVDLNRLIATGTETVTLLSSNNDGVYLDLDKLNDVYQDMLTLRVKNGTNVKGDIAKVALYLPNIKALYITNGSITGDLADIKTLESIEEIVCSYNDIEGSVEGFCEGMFYRTTWPSNGIRITVLNTQCTFNNAIVSIQFRLYSEDGVLKLKNASTSALVATYDGTSWTYN